MNLLRKNFVYYNENMKYKVYDNYVENNFRFSVEMNRFYICTDIGRHAPNPNPNPNRLGVWVWYNEFGFEFGFGY